MSIWSKISAALALFASVLFGLLQREKYERANDQRKASDGARETERKAVNALTEGLVREDKVVNDAISRRIPK